MHSARAIAIVILGSCAVVGPILQKPPVPPQEPAPPAEAPPDPAPESPHGSPPASPAVAWPSDFSFDDGSAAGRVPEGKMLHALEGGHFRPDGSYLDLQSHVASHPNGTPYGPVREGLFVRGELLTAPDGSDVLADVRWLWRCYEVDGLVFRGCIFWRAGKWLYGAHEGHAIYANAFGDLTIEDCVFYEGGAQAVQVDWRGGCDDASQGWYPETELTGPKPFVDPETGRLGRGLPGKQIAIRRCAVIECGKIRAGAPFDVEVERDSWDFTLYAPGQAVLFEDVYMRELKGTRIQSSIGNEAYASVGILHQDVRRCYPRKAPSVKLIRIKAEARLNDRPMIQVGDAEDVLLDELDLRDLGFDVADPADDRVPTVVLESSVPHAVVEDLVAPIWLELRPASDPHRPAGVRRMVKPGERWEGSPASLKL